MAREDQLQYCCDLLNLDEKRRSRAVDGMRDRLPMVPEIEEVFVSSFLNGGGQSPSRHVGEKQ